MPDDPIQVDDPIEPQDSEPQDGGEEGDIPATFEKWLDGQPETVKALYEVHTKGLRSALASERENRKTQEQELRRLAAEAEEGSQAKAALTAAADREAAVQKQLDFALAAPRQGVTDPELAYVAAEKAGFIGEEGCDFERLRERHPALFSAPVAPVMPHASPHQGGDDKGPRLSSEQLETAKRLGLSAERYAARLREIQEEEE